MTVSSFVSVSLAPPQVCLFCPQSGSRTWAAIASRGRFVVNVLAAGSADVAVRFGRPGGASTEPLRHDLDPFGVPAPPEAVAWASCHTAQVHAAGDHLVVIAAVDRHDERRQERRAARRLERQVRHREGGAVSVLRASNGTSAPALDGLRDGSAVVLGYVPFALALGAALVSTAVDPVLAWSSCVADDGRRRPARRRAAAVRRRGGRGGRRGRAGGQLQAPALQRRARPAHQRLDEARPGLRCLLPRRPGLRPGVRPVREQERGPARPAALLPGDGRHVLARVGGPHRGGGAAGGPASCEPAARPGGPADVPAAARSDVDQPGGPGGGGGCGRGGTPGHPSAPGAGPARRWPSLV